MQPPTPPDEINQVQLERLETQIRELQGAAKAARRQCGGILAARCSLAYLFAARLFREKVDSLFGWRWAVVLIGATLLWAVVFVSSLSTVSSLFGLVLGVLLFSALAYIPSDARLTDLVGRLQRRIAELTVLRDSGSTELARLAMELQVLTRRQRQWSSHLREAQARKLPPDRVDEEVEEEAEAGDELAQRLEEWEQSPRTYLTAKDLRGRKARVLFQAAAAGQDLFIRYYAGDNQGVRRRILPRQFFKVKGFRSIYFSAYDFLHSEERTFKVRNVELDE